MLALEAREAIVVLDDALARQVAETLGLCLTGTLGLLLDAKRVGLIPKVSPVLDQLQALRFRLAHILARQSSNSLEKWTTTVRWPGGDAIAEL